MRYRLLKEFRILVWPWCAVLAAALLPFLGSRAMLGSAYTTLCEISAAAFFLGVVWLAAIPFGSEFHFRTLPLLISQPFSRRQVWLEKMFVLAGMLTVVAIIHGLSFAYRSSHFPSMEVSYLIAATCSVGFWTILTRSTLNGMVAFLSTQGLFLALVVACFWWLTGPQSFADIEEISSLGITWASLLGTPICLWLGSKTFSHFQIADPLDQSHSSNPSPRALPIANWLVSQTTTPYLNLLRKEVRLLKPVWTIAAAFVVAWLIITGLALKFARFPHEISPLLDAIYFFYAAVCSATAGCLSLCEERSLGLHGWHLSQPVSVRIQWFLKLLTALIIGFLVCVILPVCLYTMTDQMIRTQLALTDSQDMAVLSGWMAGITLMAFWCASFVSRPAPAVVTTIAAFAILGLAIGIGSVAAAASSEFVSNLTSQIAVRNLYPLSWPADLLSDSRAWEHAIFSLFVVPAVIIAWQSWRNFRVPPERITGMLRMIAFPSLVALVIAFIVSVLPNSRQYRFDTPTSLELQNALRSLNPKPVGPNQVSPSIVTPEALIATGLLSPQTREWIAGARIRLNGNLQQYRNPNSGTAQFHFNLGMSLTLRNGKFDYIAFSQEITGEEFDRLIKVSP